MTINHPKLPQHVVAVPYPAQGHITPMLQLCQQLLPHGLTFTFVNTGHIHQRLQRNAHPAVSITQLNGEAPSDVRGVEPQATAGSSPPALKARQEAVHANGTDGDHLVQIHSLHDPKRCDPIRMVFVEGGCAPEAHAHIASLKQAFEAAQDMKEQVEELISNIMEEQPVSFLMTDVFCGWGSATAKKFGIPWVCFSPASAAICSIFMHLADLSEQGKPMPVTDKEDGEVPVIDGIPGLPPTSLLEIPKVWDNTGKVSHPVVNNFSALDQASFLLLNTFSELEEQVLAALSSRCPTLPVGPLIPSHIMDKSALHTCPDNARAQLVVSRPSLFKEDRTCLNWLDTQAPSSVLFISFGSISARTQEQLEELEHAVEASGCPFLWVRRPDPSTNSPPAAQKHGKGLWVPWAPQLEVLSHPSVGCFLTHCGWNSVMESVAMGVPMLCWADTQERMSNQRFVVQFWKCGVDMVLDKRSRFKQHIDEAVLVKREELEKAIRGLMKEESGSHVRDRATQLQNLATSAFCNLPIQFNNFLHAIQHLCPIAKLQ